MPSNSFSYVFSVSLQPTDTFPEGQMLTVKLTLPPRPLKTGENTGIGKPKLGGPVMFPLGDWKLCCGYSSLLELPEVKIFEATCFCWIATLSYCRKALVERWPVTSCITFSGTSFWKRFVAPDTHKLWFVKFPFSPASLHIFFTISLSAYSLMVALNTMDRHPWICQVGGNKMCQFL